MNPRTDRKDDAVAKTRVRVTQEPSVVREVDEAEFTDLRRQGLLHSHNRGDGTSPNPWEPKKESEDVVQTADIASTEKKEAKK